MAAETSTQEIRARAACRAGRRSFSSQRDGHGVAVAVVVALLVVSAVTACAGSPSAAPEPTPPAVPGSTVAERPVVVASTPLVGALVRSVVGDQAEVRVLIADGDDPSSATVTDPSAAIEDVDLVVLVDPTYEVGLAPVLDRAAEASIPTLALAPQLNPIPLGGSELDPDRASTGGATDPHVWLDPDRWTQAARLVGAEVVELGGVDAATIAANVAAFDDATAQADETVQAAVATVPDDRRVVVSDLPALAYLTDRYGFELVLVDGPGELGAAASDHGTTVVFTEHQGLVGAADELATSYPRFSIVGLELDRPTSATGPAASTELLITAATMITTALSA